MCEVIDTTNVPETGFVADGDILCYKILAKPIIKTDFDWMSIVYGMKYSSGQTYRSLMCARRAGVYRVCTKDIDGNIRFALVSDDSLQEMIGIGCVVGNPVIVGDAISCGGFHSYTRYMNEKMKFDCKVYGNWRTVHTKGVEVVRCRIPAGSAYFVSENCGAYISDTIVMEEAVCAL